MKWLKESNRLYHVGIGFFAAMVGTIIAAMLVAGAMEGKDCQGDPDNQGKPLRQWTWRKWDWKDFFATVIGGVGGQVVQIGIVLLAWWLI